MLAIVAACGEWSHLLLNKKDPFIIKTEHNVLEYFRTLQKLNQQQARWHYKLLQFNFCIEYIRGNLNVIPDLLSRDPRFACSKTKLEEFNNATILPEELFALMEISTCDETPIFMLSEQITVILLESDVQLNPDLYNKILSSQPLALDYHKILDQN